MKAIKKRFIGCIIVTILCAVAMLGFACSAFWYIAIPLAAATIIMMILTIRMLGRYQSARLICENPILDVGMASVSETGENTAKETVNVVVSGFGILMDGKPYTFGHGGIELMTIAISRERIKLSFGSNEKEYSVCLLHGIADIDQVDTVAKRLLYETGVTADISGWSHDHND